MSKTASSKPKVFIQGPGAAPYIMMFLANGYVGTRTLEEADVVCFTGGEDVDPELYHEPLHYRTHFNRDRDEADIKVFNRAMELKKFCVGICRGGQFLNVASGGRLWQHVDKHAGKPHEVFYTRDKDWISFTCTSTHHQAMRPSVMGEVLGVCWEAEIKESGLRVWKRAEAPAFTPDVPLCSGPEDDIEVVWYEENQCLCFQPHPEMHGYPECTKFFFMLMDKYFKKQQRKAA